jgi:hypothetical protein
MLIIEDFETFKKFNPEADETQFEEYKKIFDELKRDKNKYMNINNSEFEDYIKQNPDKPQNKLLDEFIDLKRKSKEKFEEDKYYLINEFKI